MLVWITKCNAIYRLTFATGACPRAPKGTKAPFEIGGGNVLVKCVYLWREQAHVDPQPYEKYPEPTYSVFSVALPIFAGADPDCCSERSLI